VQLILTFHPTTTLLIQPLEHTPLLLQQPMRLPILHQTPLIHHDHLVEIENRIQFVRHSDDSVARELLTNKALHDRIGSSVKTGVARQLQWFKNRRKGNTYFEVASSNTNRLLLSRLNNARAIQNNWRCP
jgi:hypothetical protein